MATRELDNNKPEMQPVHLKGSVNEKSQGLFSDFIKQDAKTIGKYFLKNIFEPGIKDLIGNGIKYAVDMALYGESTGVYPKYGGGKNGYTNYNTMSINRSTNSANRVKPVNPYQPKEFTFDDLLDAQGILNSLSDRMDKYGCFSIGDYYRALGKGSLAGYTDNDWGWNDMRQIHIVHVAGNGWAIEFPDAISLKEI